MDYSRNQSNLCIECNNDGRYTALKHYKKQKSPVYPSFLGKKKDILLVW